MANVDEIFSGVLASGLVVLQSLNRLCRSWCNDEVVESSARSPGVESYRALVFRNCDGIVGPTACRGGSLSASRRYQCDAKYASAKGEYCC